MHTFHINGSLGVDNITDFIEMAFKGGRKKSRRVPPAPSGSDRRQKNMFFTFTMVASPDSMSGEKLPYGSGSSGGDCPRWGLVLNHAWDTDDVAHCKAGIEGIVAFLCQF